MRKLIETEYKWKDFYGSVSVSADAIDQRTLDDLESAKTCADHWYLYALGESIFFKPYRLYRRGRNRCHRCGVKISTGKGLVFNA